MKAFDFSAKDEKLKDVIWGNDIFQMPRYQRPYSWDQSKAEDLWADVFENRDTIFLGSFIFNTGTGDNRIEVIDGQQRLLTIIILCAALRDLAVNIDTNLAGTIQNQCIRGGFLGDKERVICGDTLNEFFLNYIQKYPKEDFPLDKTLSKEQRLVTNTYRLFSNKIKKHIEGASCKEDSIKELLEVIGNVKVIKIQIQDEDLAYNIFETVNARGTDLSVSDLLKNLIFKNVREERLSKDNAKEKWLEIEENVDGDMKKFTRYFWLSRYSFVTEKGLYREIKAKIKDFEGFLDSLYLTSNHFRVLSTGEKSEWLEFKNGKKAFRSVQGIRALGVSQCYVLLLALMVNREKLPVPVDKWMELIENATFCYSSIGKLPANKLERQYSKAALGISEAMEELNEGKKRKLLVREYERLKKTLRDLLPSNELFRDNFLEITYKESEKSRIFLKYIFSKMERELGNKELALDYDSISIEHLLPKAPSVEWGVTEDQVKPYVNMIGNLTIISQDMNGKIGNKPMSEKIRLLKTSKLCITEKVTKLIIQNKLCWGESEIRERSLSLAQEAYEMWSIR